MVVEGEEEDPNAEEEEEMVVVDKINDVDTPCSKAIVKTWEDMCSPHPSKERTRGTHRTSSSEQRRS